jgi:hypothetical protein
MPVEACPESPAALVEAATGEDPELAQAVGGFINRMLAAVAFERALTPGLQQTAATAGQHRAHAPGRRVQTAWAGDGTVERLAPHAASRARWCAGLRHP